MLHCWHCSWSTMVDLLPAWQALLSSLLGLTPSYRFTLPCYSKCLWSLLLKWLVLHGVVSWPAWDFYTLHRHQRTWNSCICHIAMDCAWKKKNHHIVVFTDNSITQGINQQGYFSSSLHASSVTSPQRSRNTLWLNSDVPGVDNVLPDTTSRLFLPRTFSIFPALLSNNFTRPTSFAA